MKVRFWNLDLVHVEQPKSSKRLAMLDLPSPGQSGRPAHSAPCIVFALVSNSTKCRRLSWGLPAKSSSASRREELFSISSIQVEGLSSSMKLSLILFDYAESCS